MWIFSEVGARSRPTHAASSQQLPLYATPSFVHPVVTRLVPRPHAAHFPFAHRFSSPAKVGARARAGARASVQSAGILTAFGADLVSLTQAGQLRCPALAAAAWVRGSGAEGPQSAFAMAGCSWGCDTVSNDGVLVWAVSARLPWDAVEMACKTAVAAVDSRRSAAAFGLLFLVVRAPCLLRPLEVSGSCRHRFDAAACSTSRDFRGTASDSCDARLSPRQGVGHCAEPHRRLLAALRSTRRSGGGLLVPSAPAAGPSRSVDSVRSCYELSCSRSRDRLRFHVRSARSSQAVALPPRTPTSLLPGVRARRACMAARRRRGPALATPFTSRRAFAVAPAASHPSPACRRIQRDARSCRCRRVDARRGHDRRIL